MIELRMDGIGGHIDERGTSAVCIDAVAVTDHLTTRASPLNPEGGGCRELFST